MHCRHRTLNGRIAISEGSGRRPGRPVSPGSRVCGSNLATGGRGSTLPAVAWQSALGWRSVPRTDPEGRARGRRERGSRKARCPLAGAGRDVGALDLRAVPWRLAPPDATRRAALPEFPCPLGDPIGDVSGGVRRPHPPIGGCAIRALGGSAAGKVGRVSPEPGRDMLATFRHPADARSCPMPLRASHVREPVDQGTIATGTQIEARELNE